MAYTKYHAKYYANELIKQSASNDTDRISMSLFNTCVNLNPHQVEVALFAFKSPLSKGDIAVLDEAHELRNAYQIIKLVKALKMI